MPENPDSEISDLQRRNLFSALLRPFKQTAAIPQEQDKKAGQEQKGIPRRTFLRWLSFAAASAVMTGALKGSDFSFGEAIEKFKYVWKEREEKIQYGKERFFVDGDSELEKGLVHRKVAYVFTHLGYSEYMLGLLSEFEKGELYKQWASSSDKEVLKVKEQDARNVKKLLRGAYGNYKTYISNIVPLLNHLQQTGALVIFAVEQRDLYQPDIPRPELQPYESAMIAVTHTDTGDFLDYEAIKTLDGDKLQRPDLMYSLLRRAGVEEIRVGGEWSYNVKDTEGCLGGVARQFYEQGFRVRGIAGVVFPVMYGGIENMVIKNLYSDAISSGEVLQGK